MCLTFLGWTESAMITRCLARMLLTLAVAILIPARASAQVPTDSSDLRARARADAPPISAGRAFLYSALVPGLGQAALDRKYSGAVFFLIEAFSLSVARRSADDLQLAQAFLGDSVPVRYDIDPTTGVARRDAKGNPVVAEWRVSGYTTDLVRARKLQLEDWVAVVVFNHLIAGADAFVAANLWDLPRHVSLRAFPTRRGAGVAMSLSFR